MKKAKIFLVGNDEAQLTPMEETAFILGEVDKIAKGQE